ncbi:hypothetical protein ACJX0J_031729, partial [Zea mays]
LWGRSPGAAHGQEGSLHEVLHPWAHEDPEELDRLYIFLAVQFQKWNGSKKISLAIDLLYLWIWGLLGCRGSIKTQRQRYIRNDVMLAG